MNKLLILTTWDFSAKVSVGITRKIKAQIKAFERAGYSVNYTFISNSHIYLNTGRQEIDIGYVGSLRKIKGNLLLWKKLKKYKYKYVYSRYGLADTFYCQLLKMLHENGSRIVVEIPTYPYDQEKPAGISWQILYDWDKLYRKQLKRYVDRILTYSGETSIFGIPTIFAKNGIDIESIPIRHVRKSDGKINLIAVAGLAKWHGYDRLIKGLGEYYRKGGRRIVNFHIIGNGPPIAEYKQLIEINELQEHVFLHGLLYGENLDAAYDNCDIGIENLGFHRTGIKRSSTLKAKEYAAKGLPFVTSLFLDTFEGEEFVLHVPGDESNIDINEIVSFYDRLYRDGMGKIWCKKIRDLAERECAIDTTMQPVFSFFQNGE